MRCPCKELAKKCLPGTTIIRYYSNSAEFCHTQLTGNSARASQHGEGLQTSDLLKNEHEQTSERMHIVLAFY